MHHIIPVGKIPQIWPDFEFWGLPCTPLHSSWPNLACKNEPLMYSFTPNFRLIGVHCRPCVAKNSKFDCIFNFNILWLHHQVAHKQSCIWVHNYKASKMSKPFLNSNDLTRIPWAWTQPFKSVDKQKNKEYKLTNKKTNIKVHALPRW